jgi:hypothetical protein
MKDLEIKEIEKNLKELSVNPDKVWEDKTIQNLKKFSEVFVTEKFSTRKKSRNIILNFTSILMTGSKKTLLTGISLTLVVSLGIAGGILFLNSNKQVKKEELNLTAEQQAEIFENIAKQNSEIINTRINSGNSIASAVSPALATTQEKATEDTEELAADISSTSKLIAPALPYTQDHTYSYSTTKSEMGPAVEKCAAMNLNNLYAGFADSTSESYTYNDIVNGSYYSKYLTRTDSNEVLSYYLSESHPTRSESLEYLGGKYAAKTISTFPAIGDPVASVGFEGDLIAPTTETMPAEEEIDYLSVIQSLYGPDAKITQKAVDEEGKEYYIIEYSYGMNCDEEATIFKSYIAPTGDDYTDKIVIQDWVSLDKFNIGKTQMYLDSAEESNLIMETSTTSEYSDVDFGSVASNFEFEFDVEVKEKLYDYSQDDYTYDPRAEAEKAFNNLDDLNTNIIFVDEPKYEVTSLYISDLDPTDIVKVEDDFYDYLTDRDFYSDSELGQQMYESAVEWNNYDYNYINDYALSLASLTQLINKETYESITLDVYDANKDDFEKIKKTYISPDYVENLTESTVQLNIDNTSVDATLYTFEEGGVIMYDAPAGSMDSTSLRIADPLPGEGEMPAKIKTQIVMFNYLGANYTMRLPFDGFDLTTVKFKSYNTSNADALNFLKEQLDYVYVTLYEQYQPDAGQGVTEPALY